MIPPYTNEPEGHDCFTKIGYYTKIGTKFGLFAALYDVILYSKTSGYMPTIQRYIRTTFPFAAAGATFATTACALTNLRNKDDHLNYFVSGVAAGTVFGLGFGNRNMAIGLAITAGVLGIFMKDSMLNNWGWGFDQKEFDLSYILERNRLHTKYPSQSGQSEQ